MQKKAVSISSNNTTPTNQVNCVTFYTEVMW